MHNLQALMNYSKDQTTGLKISLEPIQEKDENEANLFNENKANLLIKANEKSIDKILPDTFLAKYEAVLDTDKENITASDCTKKFFIKLNAKQNKQEKNYLYHN